MEGCHQWRLPVGNLSVVSVVNFHLLKTEKAFFKIFWSINMIAVELFLIYLSCLLTTHIKTYVQKDLVCSPFLRAYHVEFNQLLVFSFVFS